VGAFGAINRFAINTMFINPVGYMRNVVSDWTLSRGDLWGSPLAYGRMAQTMRQAWYDVWNKTPFYHQILQEGGALMGAGASNRVAFDALMGKIREEMAADPMIDRIAKERGSGTQANRGGALSGINPKTQCGAFTICLWFLASAS
jgi:hypothetical protein